MLSCKVLKEYDPKVLDLLVESVINSPYSQLEINRDLLEFHIHQWIHYPENGVIIILYDNEEPVGLLVTRRGDLLFSPAVVAQELMWYVKEEYRGKDSLSMLALFEQWATWIKAEVIAVSTLNNKFANRLGRFYEKHGFNKSETSYYKVFK